MSTLEEGCEQLAVLKTRKNTDWERTHEPKKGNRQGRDPRTLNRRYSGCEPRTWERTKTGTHENPTESQMWEKETRRKRNTATKRRWHRANGLGPYQNRGSKMGKGLGNTDCIPKRQQQASGLRTCRKDGRQAREVAFPRTPSIINDKETKVASRCWARKQKKLPGVAIGKKQA